MSEAIASQIITETEDGTPDIGNHVLEEAAGKWKDAVDALCEL